MFDFVNPEVQFNSPLPAPQEGEYSEQAWGIEKFGEPIKPLTIPRPNVGDDDVKLDVIYCGICHSDVTSGTNELPGMFSRYPCVAGHELAGKVLEVGKNVKDVKVGDKAGIGCYVDSCFECPMCKDKQENYCFKHATTTYNGIKMNGHINGNLDIHTFGGYSNTYVCHQRFVFKLPDDMPLEKAGPLFCAGITMFEPLYNHGALEGKKMNIGVAGIGGLGTMGIKLANKMGHTVTAISSSERKKDLALGKGAHNYVAMSNKESVSGNMASLNLIIDTVPVHHDIKPYMSLLAPGGTLVLLGAVAKDYDLSLMDLIPMRNVTCSVVGGTRVTKEMVKFCHENEVYPDIDIITADKLNDVWGELQKVGNTSSTRYVLDIKASLNINMFDFLNPEIQFNFPLPEPQENEYKESAWGIEKFGEPIKPLTIPRANIGDDDVKLDVIFCGVCHSDVAAGTNEVPGVLGRYPCVAGHELAGKVREIGKNVTNLKVGDKAGIGCFVDSCFDCPMCSSGQENYCFKHATGTYNGMKTNGHIKGNLDIHTFGGYSNTYVCHQRFVFKLPDDMPLEKAGPLFCAGITMFEPLYNHGALEGKKMNIGIAGIGGLGTMGIKLANKMGHTVTAISSSERKREMALGKGAHNYVAMSNKESVSGNMASLNLIIDTVPVHHDIKPYMSLLAPGGTLVLIGVVPKNYDFGLMELIPMRKITCSVVGGTKVTKEMVKFCYEHQVYPDIDIITADKLNDVWEELQKVGNANSTRYVLDIKASLK